MSAGLRAALTQEEPADRLQAAMTAGSRPDSAFIVPLIERCRVEPDFYVREMLTWALLHHSAGEVLLLLKPELHSSIPQARSQALHTLSKIGDVETQRWVTREHLHDTEDEVARAAWRTAAGLTRDAVQYGVTEVDDLSELCEELLQELGRGDFEVKRSLSRALIELGDTIEGPLRALASQAEPHISAHAAATLQLYADPESSFTLA